MHTKHISTPIPRRKCSYLSVFWIKCQMNLNCDSSRVGKNASDEKNTRKLFRTYDEFHFVVFLCQRRVFQKSMKKSFKISNECTIWRKYQPHNYSQTDWHENETAFISQSFDNLVFTSFNLDSEQQDKFCGSKQSTGKSWPCYLELISPSFSFHYKF